MMLSSLSLALTSLAVQASVNSSGLYSQMIDTTQPLPMFFEGWSVTGFNGVSNTAPPGSGAPLDSQSQSIVEFTVSGAAGATSMTYSSGTAAWAGTGAWGGCIQHDDGTYGIYTISGLTGGTFNIQPPLRATCTNRTLSNIEGAVNGQHMREPSYRALARSIMSKTIRDVYRNRFAAKWRASAGAKTDWINLGGLGSGQYNHGTSNAFVSSYDWRGRGNVAIIASPTSTYTGKGLSQTFSIGGNAGVMEAFVSCARSSPASFAEFRVQLIVDSVTVFNEVYPANSGLVRVLADYPAGNSAQLIVTRDAEEAYAADLRIGDVTFWVYDRALTPSDYAIKPNDNVVVIGDSWTTFYGGVLGAEMQAVQTARGGSGVVTSVGMAGQTAEWGLAEFDARVPQHSPDVVLIHFYINDRNAYGLANSERWLKSLYQIGRKCQQIGARPYFVMPLPTASISQSAELGQWAERIGLGVQL